MLRSFLWPVQRLCCSAAWSACLLRKKTPQSADSAHRVHIHIFMQYASEIGGNYIARPLVEMESWVAASWGKVWTEPTFSPCRRANSSASRAIRCVAFTTLHYYATDGYCRTLLFNSDGKCRGAFCHDGSSQWIVGELDFDAFPVNLTCWSLMVFSGKTVVQSMPTVCSKITPTKINAPAI